MRRTLAGLRVAVSRPTDRATDLIRALTDAGAVPISLPLISTAPVPVASVVQRALSDVPAWWLFASPGAALPVRRGLDEALRSRQPAWAAGERLKGIKIAAVGDGSAAALHAQGLSVDFVPPEPLGESLAATLPLRKSGEVCYLWQGNLGLERLGEMLVARGARVKRVTTYITRAHTEAAATLRAMVIAGQVDAWIVTSPSMIDTFAVAGAVAPEYATVSLVCGGPTTAARAQRAGLVPAAVAQRPDTAGLLAALRRAIGS